MGIMPCQLVNS